MNIWDMNIKGKNMKTKNIIKNIRKYLLIFLILIVIYIILLCFTNLIPTKIIEKNVCESSEQLVKIGEKETIYNKNKTNKTILFRFTDALMINMAYSVDSKTPLYSAMLCRKDYIPNKTKEQVIEKYGNIGTDKKYTDKYDNTRQTHELYGLVHGDNITTSYTYARYWHGYQIFLRPLLIMFNYAQIQVVMQIIVIILLALLIVLLNKKINLIVAFVFLFCLVSMNIITIAKSFNEITVFIIALVSMIYILKKYTKEKDFGILFFIIGSVTSFLDLLTNPLITIGLPVLSVIIMDVKENKKYKESILKYIKYVCLWIIAYFTTWGIKWVLVDVLYNTGIIKVAINQVLFRFGIIKNINSNSIEIELSYIDTLKKIYKEFMVKKLVFNIVFILFIVLVYCINMFIKISKNSKNIKDLIKKNEKKQNIILKFVTENCLFFITALMPIVWYKVLKEHSSMHFFLVNRMLVITQISIMLIIINILGFIRDDNLKLKFKEIKK